MKNRLLVLVFAAFMATGCGALQREGAIQKVVEALPTIVQYVQDADMILDAIDRAALPVLAIKGDPALNSQYAESMDVARRTLQVALRSAQGGQELSKQEVDAAFASFREAYVNLTSLLQQSGLMNGAGTFAAASGMRNLTVPEPLAVTMTGPGT